MCVRFYWKNMRKRANQWHIFPSTFYEKIFFSFKIFSSTFPASKLALVIFMKNSAETEIQRLICTLSFFSLVFFVWIQVLNLELVRGNKWNGFQLVYSIGPQLNQRYNTVSRCFLTFYGSVLNKAHYTQAMKFRAQNCVSLRSRLINLTLRTLQFSKSKINSTSL